MNERKHAIVIGASMAGLLATRVLSNHFTQVTLVERDPVLSIAFHRVANLLDPPSSVLRPGIALRVMAGGLRPRHVVVNRADEQDLGALGGHDLTVV